MGFNAEKKRTANGRESTRISKLRCGGEAKRCVLVPWAVLRGLKTKRPLSRWVESGREKFLEEQQGHAVRVKGYSA
jgi:hypothetical protein